MLGEVGLVRVAFLLVPVLPRSVIVTLARCFGTMGYFLAAGTRRIGLANLDMAYGAALPQAQKRRILRDSFRTFALVILDLFWFGRRTRQRIAAWVDVDPSFDRYTAQKPMIAVTAHVGNWEVLGLTAALRGSESATVAAEIKNPAVELMLNRVRQATGQKLVERRGAVRSLLKELRGGGTVALVLDQNTAPEEGGVFVDFFGSPVPVSAAGAALAAKTGAGIVLVFCVPEARGRYRVSALPRMHVKLGDPDAIREGTRALARGIEAEIRRHPGQWLWTYKRWKYIPRGVPREKYPFYAHYVRSEED